MDLFPFARPALHALEPERAHRLTLWALRRGLAPKARAPADPILGQTLWGRHFPNPIGLAAGFDKDAEAVGPLLDAGFGFVEVGSITPSPQAGNPRPRVFRLRADRGLINRLGFNSQGIAVAAANLRRSRARPRRGLVGVNLGKNRETTDSAADYAAGVRELAPLADYLAVNVSSPNTPGLRALQSRAALEMLLSRVRQARDALALNDPPPVLLKIAPDLSDDDMIDIAEIAKGPLVDGLIVSNTTVTRPAGLQSPHAEETGGLSGRPLFPVATARVRRMYSLTNGQVPIIAVGGVENVETAMAKIQAGASLVALYTALVYQGPSLVTRLQSDMSKHLRENGYSTIAQAVGSQQ